MLPCFGLDHFSRGTFNNMKCGAAAKPCFHAVPPSDPLRQANRLPIKVLKMLTARTGHILHPEYLQPLPSTPVSPIEVRTSEPAPDSCLPSRPSAGCAWRLRQPPSALPCALKCIYSRKPASFDLEFVRLQGRSGGETNAEVPCSPLPGPLLGKRRGLKAASLDAKKSPLALLAQTCSQIGKPDPSPSSKLSSVTSNGSGGDKDSKSGPLKLSDIGDLLSHLRTHPAFPGTDKLLSTYPSSSSLASAAAAAMACHMHIPTTGAPGSPGTLALRSPHHALGLGSRYHPYSKSPLPTPGAPVPVPAATGPYYSPYALYGQRLTTASALGYQ
ncbi:PREDICTED: zinc finger protein 503-like [Chaetura pelagica]|uniref:zinc finger protein 503-like n=1 Tax=Chaetura pelagica TaxID=8897 RepID=UPI0005237F45|nr:PREDICTED: zinc finger protein 503-like [Chaetura pelagica]